MNASTEPASRSRRLPQHERFSDACTNDHVFLIRRAVLERDDSAIGLGSTGSTINDGRGSGQRVSYEHRIRKLGLVEPKIGDRGAQGRIRHRQTDNEAESKNTVDKNLTVDRTLRKHPVQMQRLRVHG